MQPHIVISASMCYNGVFLHSSLGECFYYDKSARDSEMYIFNVVVYNLLSVCFKFPKDVVAFELNRAVHWGIDRHRLLSPVVALPTRAISIHIK